MSNEPTAAAWTQDQFWSWVVEIITEGKRKLRPEHYLQGLTAEDLGQLRLALSSPGSYAEQRLQCPKWRHGPNDGELPSVNTLYELAGHVRQAAMLKGIQTQQAINAAAKDHCKKLGMDPDLTNAVIRIVGEEALVAQARGEVGSFALNAANVLLNAEAMRTKGQQEEVKIGLRKQAEARAVQRLAFDQEKFNEGVRTKLESGLAELAQYIKGNAKAQAAYETFKAEVKLATK